MRSTAEDGREDLDIIPLKGRNESRWVESFPVRPVKGEFGSRTVQFWVPVGEGVEIISTELIDLVTGLPPAPGPIAECPRQAYRLTYEGPRAGYPDYYGIVFELSNWFAPPCDAPEREWQYSVLFKR